MTLPYIWYRALVCALLCMTVNHVWWFFKESSSDGGAGCLRCQVGTTFRKALFLSPPPPRHMKVNYFWICFFFSNGWLYMSHGARIQMIFFSVHLIPFFFSSSYFLLPLNHSTVTGTYLWDICRKVGISMWKGSCRQCYALCIHSICMKCSRCHSC